jgi:electron transfer flavoprotein beta subunit
MTKILVPIKRVPDYAAKIKIAADTKSIQTDGIKWIINPFDEIAVEEALRIKESFAGKQEIEVIVLSIGPESIGEQIRSALAMGADRGILVSSDGAVDSNVAALVISEIVTKESPTLVIMGKQAVDSDSSQTGQLVAGQLDYPQATFASKITISDAWDSATVVREVDGGLETISVTLPAIVTTDLRLNEPRYPSLPNIVKAKKKPLDIVPISSLPINANPGLEILLLELPAAKKAGIKVQSVAELVEKLHKDAKVI